MELFCQTLTKHLITTGLQKQVKMNVLHLAICTEYEGMEELITLISEKLMYRQVQSFETLVKNTGGQRRAAERWNGVRLRTSVAVEFSRARSNTCDETVSLLGELFFQVFFIFSEMFAISGCSKGRPRLSNSSKLGPGNKKASQGS